MSRKQALGPMSRRRLYVAAELLALLPVVLQKGATRAQLVFLGRVELGAGLSHEYRESRGEFTPRVHLDSGRLGGHAADAPR